MEIQYIDRATGRLEVEKVYGRRALALAYGDSIASHLFAYFLLPLIARVPFFSRLYGLLQKRKGSHKKVAPFIEAYHVDTSEFLKLTFHSFNDFFIRKLQPLARPMAPGAKTIVMPADGRYLVFPDLRHVERFYVKGQEFSLSEFTQSAAYAHRYRDGSMVIARLCPTDYHRFHFPSDGVPSQPKQIQGALFSVSPIALRKRLAILWENRRCLTEIATPFGTTLYVEVGATCVGTIHQTFQPGLAIRKGDEKGYFSFGGSCLVLLFEKGRIIFDRDLIENSARGIETKAKMGESLGQGTVSSASSAELERPLS
jgi:phosphatidylserine decarboxylase